MILSICQTNSNLSFGGICMKKNIIIVICVILVIILLGIMLFNKEKEIDNTRIDKTEFEHSTIYDEDGNLLYDISKSKEIEEIIEKEHL